MNLLKKITIRAVLAVSSINLAFSGQDSIDPNGFYMGRDIHLEYSTTKTDNKKIENLDYYDRMTAWKNPVEEIPNSGIQISEQKFKYSNENIETQDCNSENLFKKTKKNLSPFLTLRKEYSQKVEIDYDFKGGTQPYKLCIENAVIDSNNNIVGGFGYVDGGSHGDLDGTVDYITIAKNEQIKTLIRKNDYQTNKEVFEQADKDIQLVKPIVEKTIQDFNNLNSPKVQYLFFTGERFRK